VRIVNATPLAKYRPGFQTGEMERYFLPRALLPDGWARDVLLTVADGTVTALHSGAAAGNAVRLSGVALPGMPNLHSHAFQRGMAGLAQRGGDFWSWREVMYRFQAALAPDDIEAIAAIAYMEMLEAGFTAVAEFHYVHHAPDGTAYANPAELSARIAAAAETSGIGLTMLPVFYAHGSFNAMPPTPGQRRFVNDIDSYARLLDGTARAIAALPDAQLGIAPHSLRAATIPELGQLVQLAAGRVLHIHIAEQTLEVDDCLAATGQRPVEHLLANIAVDHRWCLVHATARSPGCARSPRPIWAMVCFPPLPGVRRVGGSGLARIPTPPYPRRRSCGCWSTASGCSIAHGICWHRQAFLLGAICGIKPWAVVRRR
jgi:formimidoylglutamate deiminase